MSFPNALKIKIFTFFVNNLIRHQDREGSILVLGMVFIRKLFSEIVLFN